MRLPRAKSGTVDRGTKRGPRIALGAVLFALVLLHGCADPVGFVAVATLAVPATVTALQAAGVAANAQNRESSLQDALASRTFEYPLLVVATAVDQAAMGDGRRVERLRWGDGLIVSYGASPSTDGTAGSVTVRTYGRGMNASSATVIVLRGSAGAEDAQRKVGQQLIDAVAADLSGIERRVATWTLAADIAHVFDALGQVGQRHGREVLARDARAHSLRMSFSYFVEGRTVEGFLDISCSAAGGSTVVTLVGDGKSPAIDVRKAANAVLGEVIVLLHLPG